MPEVMVKFNATEKRCIDEGLKLLRTKWLEELEPTEKGKRSIFTKEFINATIDTTEKKVRKYTLNRVLKNEENDKKDK